MASKKASHNWGKYAKKAAKRSHRGIIAIGVIFLLIGFATGYYGATYLGQNDCFELNGEKKITIAQGSSYTYHEAGARIVSLGRDLSAQVVVETNLPIDENGNCMIDTSMAGVYTITYTVDDIQYGDIKRIRTINIVGG